MADNEIAGETTGPKVGELVPQPHGGALRHGGTNAGGPGRPSDLFRERCRASLERAKALEVAESIISGDILEEIGKDDAGKPIYGATKNGDRIKAMEFLAKNGHGSPPQSLELSGPGGAAILPPAIQIVLMGDEPPASDSSVN